MSTTEGPFELAGVRTPVLLEVLATWCPHCRHEAAVLEALSHKYGARVAFLGVCGSPYANPGTELLETQDDVDAFAQAFHVAYPVAFDPDLRIARHNLLSGFPTIAIIDRDKRISYMKSGEIGQADQDAALTKVQKS